MFKAMRDWQRAYTGRDGKGPTQNLFAPCPMRDHHEVVHDAVVKFGARPMNAEAAEALADPSYAAGLRSFGRELATVLDPMWEREVASREPTPAER